MTNQRLSADQRDRILMLLGRQTARQRRLDLWAMSRVDADRLIRDLATQDDPKALTRGTGRQRKGARRR